MDEFLKAVEEDELRDKVEQATHATPREYAKTRGMAPQRVYYYIRKQKIVPDWCLCGRLVVVIKEADEFFESLEKKKAPIENTEGDTDEDQ
jgi:hypothetical protein